jgi:hypothetical protein
MTPSEDIDHFKRHKLLKVMDRDGRLYILQDSSYSSQKLPFSIYQMCRAVSHQKFGSSHKRNVFLPEIV